LSADQDSTPVNDRVGSIDPTTGAVTYVGEAPKLAGLEYPASLGIMRPAFHRILADEARAAAERVRLGMTLASIRETSDSVEVAFADGSIDRYDLSDAAPAGDTGACEQRMRIG
jgi:hypothetical protein